VTDAELCSSTG